MDLMNPMMWVCCLYPHCPVSLFLPCFTIGDADRMRTETLLHCISDMYCKTLV